MQVLPAQSIPVNHGRGRLLLDNFRHICHFLDGESLVRCRQVCRPWRKIVDTNQLFWQQAFARENGGYLDQTSRGSWQEKFKRQYITKQNIRNDIWSELPFTITVSSFGYGLILNYYVSGERLFNIVPEGMEVVCGSTREMVNEIPTSACPELPANCPFKNFFAGGYPSLQVHHLENERFALDNGSGSFAIWDGALAQCLFARQNLQPTKHPMLFDNRVVYQSRTSQIEVCDIPTQAKLFCSEKAFPGDPQITATDNHLIVRPANSEAAEVYELHTGKYSHNLPCRNYMSCIGTEFVSTPVDSVGELALWDLETGKIVRRFSCPEWNVAHFVREYNRLVGFSNDCYKAHIWNIQTGELLNSIAISEFNENTRPWHTSIRHNILYILYPSPKEKKVTACWDLATGAFLGNHTVSARLGLGHIFTGAVSHDCRDRLDRSWTGKYRSFGCGPDRLIIHRATTYLP